MAPAEAVWTCRRLAASHYATGGWSVGAVALVAGWLARTLPERTRIAAVFPDGPQRYFDTVFDDDYCPAHGLLDTPPAAEPEVIGRRGREGGRPAGPGAPTVSRPAHARSTSRPADGAGRRGEESR